MEPADLGYWFDSLGGGLVLYARQWAGGSAEDVVQEAFMRLAAQARKPENVRAWLMLTVRHAAIDVSKGDRRRERRNRKAGMDWFTRSEAASPWDGLDIREVQEALEELSADEREAITLRIWNSATYEEIAAVMGLPLSTVYNRYRSGLERLRIRWESPCRKK